MRTFTCKNCQAVFQRPKSWGVRKFCSHSCYVTRSVKGRTTSAATKAKQRTARLANNPMKGQKHTAATRTKMRAAKAANPQGAGAKAINWQGGRVVDKNGYVHVYCPSHPNAIGNYVAEHRLVMSQVLGRPLHPDEHVHHINEIVDDNRPENLELHSCGEHTALHYERRRQSGLPLWWMYSPNGRKSQKP